MRAGLLLFLVGLSVAAAWPQASRAGVLEDAIPSDRDARIAVSAREILERALDNLYGCDLSQQVELVTTQNGKAVRRHEVTLMRKRIRGRAHTLYDYTMNNELYGFRALRVEREDGVVDRFLFLPQFLRVRRFTSAQRSDTVLGTNLHFEDLDVRHPDTWSIVGRSVAALGDETVHRLVVEPNYEIDYDWAEVLVEPEKYALRRLAYYRAGEEQPFRVITAPPEEMVPFPDRILPSHWVIEEPRSGVRTDVYFRRIRTHTEARDGLFSARTLEATSPLPAFPGER